MKAKEIKNEKKKSWRHRFLIWLFLSTSLSWTVLSSPASAQDKLKRFHLRIEIGHFWSDGVGGNFKELLRNWGYGYFSRGGAGIGEGPSKQYPAGEQGNNFIAFKVDYSLSARWALRLKVTPSVKWDIEGIRMFKKNPFSIPRFLSLKSRFKGGSYYAGFVYTTAMTEEKGPILHEAKYVWNFGAGIGLEIIRLDYEMSEGRSLALFGSKSSANFSKKGIGSYVFGELEYFRSVYLSLGGHVSYKYVFPVKFESFQLTVYYANDQGKLESFAAIFPEHRVNFSGFGIGLDIGLHF